MFCEKFVYNLLLKESESGDFFRGLFSLVGFDVVRFFPCDDFDIW